MKIWIAALLLAACHAKGPKQDTFPEPQLGESRKSPGADASKPAPVTPDDPRVMNISATITPQQSAQAAAPPVQVAPAPTPPVQVAPAPAPVRTPTTSTPVTPPTDIAPPATTTAPPEPKQPPAGPQEQR